MKYDVQAANAIAADYAGGNLPKIIDTGASFSNTIYPNAQYGVSLDGLATTDVTVTVSAGNNTDGEDKKELFKVTVKKGSRLGYAPIPTIPGRYIFASAAGEYRGKITAGIVYGVASPMGVDLNV